MHFRCSSLRCGIDLSERAIARSLSLSPSTVGNIESRAKEAGITWPLPPHLDERKLEIMLFPKAAGRSKNRAEPDWNHLYKESKRRGVTLHLLWLENKNQHPEGYQYNQFCERFNQWKKTLQLSLQQEHRQGLPITERTRYSGILYLPSKFIRGGS